MGKVEVQYLYNTFPTCHLHIEADNRLNVRLRQQVEIFFGELVKRGRYCDEGSFTRVMSAIARVVQNNPSGAALKL